MTGEQTKPGSILAQEYAAYKKLQAQLWERFRGGFTLIKGSELIGVYPNEDMAMAKGHEKFGADAFLVKEIYAPGLGPAQHLYQAGLCSLAA